VDTTGAIARGANFLPLLNPYFAQQFESSLLRGRQCFSPLARAENFPTYVASNFSYAVKRDSSCPFANEMCLQSIDSILLDTGYLNSLEHYGANTKLEHRWAWRQQAHCAPTITAGYSDVSNLRYESNGSATQFDGGRQFTHLYYGKGQGRNQMNDNLAYKHPVLNTTSARTPWLSLADKDYALM
jgi:hypothetical protein